MPKNRIAGAERKDPLGSSSVISNLLLGSGRLVPARQPDLLLRSFTELPLSSYASISAMDNLSRQTLPGLDESLEASFREKRAQSI
jgi:hypothetical protein